MVATYDIFQEMKLLLSIVRKVFMNVAPGKTKVRSLVKLEKNLLFFASIHHSQFDLL